MFAGFQTFECKQGKKFEMVMLWNSTILPELAKQSGCKGGLLLVDPESNKCMGMELWDDDVAASSFDTNEIVSEARRETDAGRHSRRPNAGSFK